MAEPQALEARGLSVHRGARRVLEDVSLSARPGEVLAVLGPNGAGKSTLLRALAGLQKHSGVVHVVGRELSTVPLPQRAALLSFVPQQSQLAASLRVSEVVQQGRFADSGFFRAGAGEREAALEALRKVDADALADRAFNQLSQGEQKRVLLARALCTGARVLLLDEPTAALDIEHVLRFCALLRELAAQGHCVIVVLHHLDEALRVADRALLLKAGRMLNVGPVREMIDAAHVRDLYGVELIPHAGLGFALPSEPP